ADFDAFARRGVVRGLRIVERAVRREAGGALACRVVAADDDRLVGLHLRKIVPALAGAVGDAVNLAGAVGVAQIGGDEVVGVEGLGVAEGERRAQQRTGERPPYIVDREAVLQQLGGLVAHQVAHALRRRPGGVVVVDAARRQLDRATRAGFGGVAYDVVEGDDLRGAGRVPHQPLAFGVVDGLD